MYWRIIFSGKFLRLKSSNPCTMYILEIISGLTDPSADLNEILLLFIRNFSFFLFKRLLFSTLSLLGFLFLMTNWQELCIMYSLTCFNFKYWQRNKMFVFYFYLWIVILTKFFAPIQELLEHKKQTTFSNWFSQNSAYITLLMKRGSIFL